MEERLERLMALYGKEATPQPVEPDIEAEVEDWRAVRRMLDYRPRRSPRSETIAAVLAASRTAHAHASQSLRPARRPARIARRRMAYFAVAIAVAVMTWTVARPHPGAPETTTVRPLAVTPESPLPSEADVASGNPETPEVSAEVRRSAPPVVASEALQLASTNTADDADEGDGLFVIEDEDLSWDHSDEVREIYDRLEELYAISPPGSHWRNASERPTLAAPVGLVRSQPAALQQEY